MQREFKAIPSNWSVGQTIDYLRENKDLPEEFLEIYIVDENFKPIGTVPSSKVLRNPRESKMSSIMEDSTFLVPVDMDQEEVGNLFENYNLNSACVVDKNNKLVGLKKLNRREINQIEPYLNALEGIHVPEESVVNFQEVTTFIKN